MRLACLRCFGSGWVLALVDMLDGLNDTGRKECPICAGSGRRDALRDAISGTIVGKGGDGS